MISSPHESMRNTSADAPVIACIAAVGESTCDIARFVSAQSFISTTGLTSMLSAILSRDFSVRLRSPRSIPPM